MEKVLCKLRSACDELSSMSTTLVEEINSLTEYNELQPKTMVACVLVIVSDGHC